MRGDEIKTQIAVQNNNDMPEMKRERGGERYIECVYLCERERQRRNHCPVTTNPLIRLVIFSVQ